MDDENVPDKTDEIGINPAELGDALRYWLDPKRESSSVVAISGKWGGGKTFWWTHYIPTVQSRNVYVSLFGIADIQELEHRLLAASFGIDDATTETRVSKGLQSLGKLAKFGAETFKDIPGAAIMGGLEGYLGSVVRDAAYSRLERAVVAIDDLERRSSTLKLEQVLGFVSRLKEVWKASVVLILNEPRLSDHDQALLSDFREKVIDCDFQFTVSPLYAATIGLKDHAWAAQSAAEFGERVGLCNVRVYQRANSVLARLPVDYSALPASVQSRLATSVTALCWAQFARAPEVPSVDQLLMFHTMSSAFERGADKARKPEPYEKTMSKIAWYADDMDKLVAVVVRTGQVPSEAISKQLNTFLLDHERAQASDRIRAVWDFYRSTLHGDDEELATHLLAAFSECQQYVSVGELSSAAWLLRGLGKSAGADEMINSQIRFWDERNESFSALIESNRFSTTDAYLLEKLNLQPSKSRYETPEQLFYFFVRNNNGWSPDEEAALLSVTRRAWLDFLEQVTHDQLMPTLVRIRGVYAHLQSQKDARNITWRFSPIDVALRALKYKTKANTRLVRALLE